MNAESCIFCGGESYRGYDFPFEKREDSNLRIEIRDRLRRSRDWNLAISELEQEIEGVEDVQQRSELLFEIANVTEEIVPERERALAIYQRAWKLHPENIKALTRAREVYGDLGRLEMVAKVGQLELKLRNNDGDLAALVGLAYLDSGQRKKALPLLQLALETNPTNVDLTEALAAATYDENEWIDDVERLADDAEDADSNTAGRMLLRAARIVFHETPEDERYEELLKMSLVNNPQAKATNYLYEKLLSTAERWKELEEHHDRRIYAAADDEEKMDLSEQFGLEWVQRFKDRERAAKYFKLAIEHAAASRNYSKFNSLVAAFSLVQEIFGGSSKWNEVLELADAALPSLEGQQKLFISIQSGLIAWKEVSDIEKARRYFAIALALEEDSPDVADFVEQHGATDAPAAADEASDQHESEEESREEESEEESTEESEEEESTEVHRRVGGRRIHRGV
jgi:tetratricopeptide (TPR) repeat protein